VSYHPSALADELDAVERLGAPTDDPEGSRYIRMSDTLARRISETLRNVIVFERDEVVVRERRERVEP